MVMPSTTRAFRHLAVSSWQLPSSSPPPDFLQSLLSPASLHRSPYSVSISSQTNSINQMVEVLTSALLNKQQHHPTLASVVDIHHSPTFSLKPISLSLLTCTSPALPSPTSSSSWVSSTPGISFTNVSADISPPVTSVLPPVGFVSRQSFFPASPAPDARAESVLDFWNTEIGGRREGGDNAGTKLEDVLVGDVSTRHQHGEEGMLCRWRPKKTYKRAVMGLPSTKSRRKWAAQNR
eukprot:GHVS01009443.1.p1 GENE.GHVS01009443.1~~GHVS01009443.1.p1  ORF type:complete len:236 (-),score=62.35 GHVS01009443.1:113-820(-)